MYDLPIFLYGMAAGFLSFSLIALCGSAFLAWRDKRRARHSGWFEMITRIDDDSPFELVRMENEAQRKQLQALNDYYTRVASGKDTDDAKTT